MKSRWYTTKKWLVWIVPAILIASGAVYLALTQVVQASTQIIVPAPSAQDAPQQTVRIPVRMRIVSVGMNLTVKAGRFDQKTSQWTINETDAFFASGTTTPLLYGHNRPGIFEPLSNLTKGSNLQLVYADGSTATFRYYGTRFVAPNDASVLTENDPRTVILLTCSGLFSDSRRIVYFKEIQ